MSLLVVNYHYYREEKYPSGIYPVNRARLVAQATQIAKSHRCISQTELLALVQEKTLDDAEPLCMFTFDDGLKEQLTAVDELARLGIPAICFVPTNPIVNGKALDVHKLHFIRSQVDDARMFELLRERFAVALSHLDQETIQAHYPYDGVLAGTVKYLVNYELTAAERSSFIDEVFAGLVNDESAFVKDLYMDAKDLRELASAGALGGHGASHEPLGLLSADAARLDIQESLQVLSSIRGRPIKSFAYPYGTENSLAPYLGDILAENGVKVAFTMLPGVNRERDLLQPLFLRRLDTNEAPGGNSGATIAPHNGFRKTSDAL